MMKTKITFKALLLLLFFTTVGWGQTETLVEWTPATLPGGTNNFGSSPFGASTVHDNLTIGGLTRGSGIGTTGSGAANGWGGNDFRASGSSASTAIGDNEFVTFSITAASGYEVSIASIEQYNIRRSGTGPSTGQWQYQIGTGSFVNIGSAITWGGTTTNAGNNQPAINLSAIPALQSIPEGTTVTFRVLLYGASNTGGTWYLNGHANATYKTLKIIGAVTEIEEPSDDPTLTTTVTSLPSFGDINVGSNSSSQSFMISGSNLTDDVLVSAPAGYQVSLDNSTFEDDLFIDNQGGTLGGNVTVYVRFSPTAPGLNNGVVTLLTDGDEKTVSVSGTGVEPTPELIVSETSLDFGSVFIGENSMSQTFTVSGSFLTSNAFIVAPDDFVLSTNDVSFSSFLNLGQTGGNINGQPVTVYVRFQPSFVGSTGGEIEITSTGAVTQVISVNGSGVQPIIDAPVATAATSVGADSFVANWNAVEGAESYQVDVYTETLVNAELVTNGGFESGNTNGYASANGSGNYFINTTNPHTGSYYLSRTGTDTSIIQQDVSVEVGQTYVFSFWYNDYSASGTNGLKNFTIQGTSGTNYVEGGTPAKLPSAGTWTKYEKVFTATQSTVRISIRSYETVSIDDISIKSTSTSLVRTPVAGSPFTVSAPNTFLNVSGLNSSTTYHYVVRAYDGTVSENSNEISVTTLSLTTWYADNDGDGFGDDDNTLLAAEQPVGYVAVGGDCNDDDDTIYPGAVEICYDGILQNCNGDLNDGCPVVLARLRADNCGSTLSTINEVLRGDLVSPSVPVGVSRTGYRFRLTNTTTNAVREVERPNYVFQISTTDIAEYATVYTVEVAVRLNEQWMPYGPACTVVTPGVPSTVIAASSCGTTLAQLNNIIRAEVVPSAVNYEYEVSLIEGGVAVETTTLVRPGASFNLLQLTGISIKYGAEYRIRVKVEVPTATGLQWSTNYGAACSVFSPLAPESQIEGCGTEEGITPATLNTVVYATPVGGATQYRFTLSDGMGYSQVYTSSTRTFRLSNFNALSPLTPGGIYSVSVETLVYGSYYAGKDCNILVPGGGTVIRPTEITKEETVKTLPTEFKAIAYPNPFAVSFGLDVRTSGTEKISLAVYDMTGRLLESNEVAVTEVSNYQFGDRYPSGVYNVIVTQGEETRTVRVVKQ